MGNLKQLFLKIFPFYLSFPSPLHIFPLEILITCVLGFLRIPHGSLILCSNYFLAFLLSVLHFE